MDTIYFPISFATVTSKFQDDERACQRLCPSSEVILFTHGNPGEDVSQGSVAVRKALCLVAKCLPLP